jgi:predicted helicase
MNRTDRFIVSCSFWENFDQRMRELSKSEQGRNFERLVQLYLQSQPEYRTTLRDVWLLRDVPADVRKAINLPYLDEGIDLIARDRHGEYWAIQAKFREQDRPLTRRALGTFTSLTFNTCSNIALAVVAHSIKTRQQTSPDAQHDGDWPRPLAVSRSGGWSLIVRKLNGRSAAPRARTPRPHQSAAVAAAKTHFVRDGAARGRHAMRDWQKPHGVLNCRSIKGRDHSRCRAKPRMGRRTA